MRNILLICLTIVSNLFFVRNQSSNPTTTPINNSTITNSTNMTLIDPNKYIEGNFYKTVPSFIPEISQNSSQCFTNLKGVMGYFSDFEQAALVLAASTNNLPDRCFNCDVYKQYLPTAIEKFNIQLSDMITQNRERKRNGFGCFLNFTLQGMEPLINSSLSQTVLSYLYYYSETNICISNFLQSIGQVILERRRFFCTTINNMKVMALNDTNGQIVGFKWTQPQASVITNSLVELAGCVNKEKNVIPQTVVNAMSTIALSDSCHTNGRNVTALNATSTGPLPEGRRLMSNIRFLQTNITTTNSSNTTNSTTTQPLGATNTTTTNTTTTTNSTTTNSTIIPLNPANATSNITTTQPASSLNTTSSNTTEQPTGSTTTNTTSLNSTSSITPTSDSNNTTSLNSTSTITPTSNSTNATSINSTSTITPTSNSNNTTSLNSTSSITPTSNSTNATSLNSTSTITPISDSNNTTSLNSTSTITPTSNSTNATSINSTSTITPTSNSNNTTSLNSTSTSNSNNTTSLNSTSTITPTSNSTNATSLNSTSTITPTSNSTNATSLNSTSTITPTSNSTNTTSTNTTATDFVGAAGPTTTNATTSNNTMPTASSNNITASNNTNPNTTLSTNNTNGSNQTLNGNNSTFIILPTFADTHANKSEFLILSANNSSAFTSQSIAPAIPNILLLTSGTNQFNKYLHIGDKTTPVVINNLLNFTNEDSAIYQSIRDLANATTTLNNTLYTNLGLNLNQTLLSSYSYQCMPKGPTIFLLNMVQSIPLLEEFQKSNCTAGNDYIITITNNTVTCDQCDPSLLQNQITFVNRTNIPAHYFLSTGCLNGSRFKFATWKEYSGVPFASFEKDSVNLDTICLRKANTCASNKKIQNYCPQNFMTTKCINQITNRCTSSGLFSTIDSMNSNINNGFIIPQECSLDKLASLLANNQTNTSIQSQLPQSYIDSCFNWFLTNVFINAYHPNVTKLANLDTFFNTNNSTIASTRLRMLQVTTNATLAPGQNLVIPEAEDPTKNDTIANGVSALKLNSNSTNVDGMTANSNPANRLDILLVRTAQSNPNATVTMSPNPPLPNIPISPPLHLASSYLNVHTMLYSIFVLFLFMN